MAQRNREECEDDRGGVQYGPATGLSAGCEAGPPDASAQATAARSSAQRMM